MIALGLSASAIAGDHAEADKQLKAPAGIRRWMQVGQASWYGLRFQGRPTATGERFDMHHLTCAHPSLPLGSWIRVTNLRNRKSVFVRVNDRGPVTDGRIVDLSYAAAQAVGISGVGKVGLEIVAANKPELIRALLVQLRTPLLASGSTLP